METNIKLNRFEGARRTALALGALLVAGCLAYAAFSDTRVSLTYGIDTYGAPPVLIDECGMRDGRKDLYAGASKADDEAATGVTLCFHASKADGGDYLIPYRYVAARTDPIAAPLYASHADAIARGDSALASSLIKQILALPVGNAAQRDVWMAPESDAQVRNYFDEVSSGFKLTAEGVARRDQLRSAKRWELWKQAALVMFGGLAIGWALTAGIGWIVRGFMGIPRGRDARLIE